MQLYNSALTHYPRSTRKLTITLSAAETRTTSPPGEEEDAPPPPPPAPVPPPPPPPPLPLPQQGTTSSSSSSSSPPPPPPPPSPSPASAPSAANMPAFSCYEAPSLRPLCFTSTAEILIRRPDGSESCLPVHVMRRESKPPSPPPPPPLPHPLPHPSILCGDAMEDLMDHLRNGTDEMFPAMFSRRMMMMEKEQEEEEEEEDEEEEEESQLEEVKSNGWEALPEVEILPIAPSSAATQEVRRNREEEGEDVGTGSEEARRNFELSVLQETVPQRSQERGEVNEKVTRYLAEVEKQNKYLQERNKYRFGQL